MLQECVVSGRKVWVRRGGSAGRVCIFLDGEFYLDRMDALAILEGMSHLTCAFVAHIDAAGRHRDYICDPGFAAFLANDLVEALGGTDGGNILSGLSLSGLQSAYTSLQYPDRLPKCLAQSGSFWWNGQWLSSNVPTGTGKFWLSVGTQEGGAGDVHPPSGLRQDVDQMVGVERMANALRAAGHQVHLDVFEGGHTFAPWMAELKQALVWLQ